MNDDSLPELNSIWDEARNHIESGNHNKAIEIRFHRNTQEVLAERELAKKPEIVRFIRAYNKMAKQKGFDISKIYNTKTDNKKNS